MYGGEKNKCWKIRFLIVPMFFMLIYPVCGGDKTEIVLKNTRHAYLRGEQVPLKFEVTNKTGEKIPVSSAQLSVDVGGLVVRSFNLGVIPASSSVEHTFKIDSSVLKSGEYLVTCQLKQCDKVLAENKSALWIARKVNPERMRVCLWPDNIHSKTMREAEDSVKETMNWWRDRGLNGLAYWSGQPEDRLRIFDHALVNGIDIISGGHGGFETISKEDFDQLSADEKHKWVKRNAHSKYVKDPFSADVADKQEESNIRTASVLGDHPAWKMIFVNTEKEEALGGLFKTPGAKQVEKDHLPQMTKHELIAPGVIRDTDEKYIGGKRGLYRYQWGDGLTTLNSRVANVIHRYRPDVLVFTDPFRAAGIYDRFRDLDIVSTWTYTMPDPKLALDIENLVAAAKPTGQKVMHTVTFLNYPGTIAPKDKGWTMMGPDRAVETQWINLSRRPDGLYYYYSSECNPFAPLDNARSANAVPVSPDAEPENKELANLRKSPQTTVALKKLSDEVVKPYGPMISNLARSPRKVALLNSFSSRVVGGGSPILQGHYPNNQISHFLSVLNMAHIPADVVFDETIQRYGLKDYDVLVLPKCDTLLESVYKEILEFTKRGGLVISDQYLRADIPGAIKFDFDFTYRRKVNADAINSGEAMAEWNDLIDVETAKREKAKGIEALADQKIMESYAGKLRTALDGKIKREVDCSSPTALLNMLEKGDVKYLFVVNDKRTYDDRVGKWKAMMEKAVPQTVKISLNEWKHPALYAYDLLEKKLLKYSKAPGGYTFDVDLPAPGGKIIALYPEPLDKIEILIADKMKKNEKYTIKANVLTNGGKLLPGIQPLRVEITDPNGNVFEYSDYYAAKNGTLSLDFIPAINDAVGVWKIKATDLTAGKTAEKSFSVASE